MPRNIRNVKVKVGHISGSSREFTVPSNTTVTQLLEKIKIDVQEGEEVLDSNANTVDLTAEVKAGEEYTVASNLKAF